MKPNDPLHPAVVRGYFLWAGLFTPIWSLVATVAAYAGVQIVEQEPEQPWVYISLLQLLALVVCAVVSADIVAHRRKQRCMALYLRKFRGEPMEPFALNPLHTPATVAFRMPMLLDFIGLAGVRLFALRDLRTPGSRHIIFYWIPVYLLAMAVAPAMLVLYGVWVAYGAVATVFGFAAEVTTVGLLFLTATLVIAVIVFRPVQAWLRGSMERHAERVRALFQPGFRPCSIAALEKICGRSRSVGAIAIKSSDETWMRFVEYLLRRTDTVLFDIRVSSENCEAELRLIQRNNLQNRVIWVVGESQDIARTGDGYLIQEIAFAGAPRLFKVPKQLASGWRGSDAGKLLLLSQLLYAIEARPETEACDV